MARLSPFCLVLASACGNGSDGSSANAGAGGAGTGDGGSAATGASGSEAGMAGLGAGGSAGSSNSPPCPAERAMLSAADVDLSLGGLNADLPEPSKSCIDEEWSSWVCLALSAMIDGVPRELICTSPGPQLTSGTSINCRTAADEDLGLDTRNFGGTSPPGAFAVTQVGPSQGGVLRLVLPEGRFEAKDASFVEVRVAGWVNQVDDRTRCRSSSWGSVAASWVGGGDAGTGQARVRGTFHTRSF